MWHSDDDYNGMVLCGKHYAQLRRNGEIKDEHPSSHITTEDRTCDICGSNHHVVYHEGKYYCLRHYSQIKNLGGLKEKTVFDRNDYIVDGDIAYIILRNKKQEETGRAIIDAEDLDLVIKYKWVLGTWGYAETKTKNRCTLMQRLILNEFSINKIPDHDNRNKLDNRKSNLRIVDNFYQTSAFYPMPTILISTVSESGQTNLGAYSLCFPYYIAGKDYYAIRAEDGKFYDRNGTGLAKGFLRFPTAKQFRISSNFNPRRTNPVTGRVAPHRGVDFAMPQGTPVLSVGDGEVVVAKRSGAAGYYVAIRHGRSYTTRYMHLRKILVKPGQKVKRGDRIALSGNTGRSTGPHLHYEVWINQQAVNPLTAKLPRTEGLTGSDRREFLAQAKEIVPQLRFD